MITSITKACRKTTWVARASILSFLGLGAQPTQAQAPSDQNITIEFTARINGQDFVCGNTYNQVGSNQTSITPSDFRFFVTQVSLLDSQGKAVPVKLLQDNTWQIGQSSLLDFEDASAKCRNGTPGINRTIRGTLPSGNYRGLRFTLGLPFEQNHGDPNTAPAPLSTTALFWNWQGGYRFLKFDIPDTSFAVHLGSTLCASSSRTSAPLQSSDCKNPNRINVEFPNFEPGKHKVVADIGKVLSKTNVSTNTAGTAPGCMSFPKDPDCTSIMSQLGLGYDDAAPGTQQLFSIE